MLPALTVPFRITPKSSPALLSDSDLKLEIEQALRQELKSKGLLDKQIKVDWDTKPRKFLPDALQLSISLTDGKPNAAFHDLMERINSNLNRSLLSGRVKRKRVQFELGGEIDSEVHQAHTGERNIMPSFFELLSGANTIPEGKNGLDKEYRFFVRSSESVNNLLDAVNKSVAEEFQIKPAQDRVADRSR